MIYILLIIIELATLLGWFAEYLYRRLLLRAIKKKIRGKIEWLKKSHGNNDRLIEVWMDALRLIEKEEHGGK